MTNRIGMRKMEWKMLFEFNDDGERHQEEEGKKHDKMDKVKLL